MKKIMYFSSFVILSFSFFSCATLFNEENKKKEETFKIITRSMLEKEEIPDFMIVGAQYFSGLDTIILEREIPEEELNRIKLSDRGSLVFFRGKPRQRETIFPRWPGEVVEIVRNKENKEKIEALKVSFWRDSDLFLYYAPADDPDGSFILLPRTKEKNKYKVLFKGKWYDFVSGVYSPLLVKTEEFNFRNKNENAPGRIVRKKYY